MQTYTHGHFPKVKQMPNTIFPARDNQSLMKQVIPPGLWPSPHPSGCCRFMHQHSSGAHTHTHLSVIQQYASSTIWGSQAPSYCVKIACCKRIHKHRQWWPGQFFQEICNTIFVRVYYFRCWICWQADNAPLNVQLRVPPVFMLHSQLFLRTSNKNLLQTGCSYFY